jgi:hypothetical protein
MALPHGYASSGEMPVRVLEAGMRDGRIALPIPDDEVAREVEGEGAFIFRGVFGAEEIGDLRSAVASWSRDTPEFPKGVSASREGLNFHRRDDGSQPTLLPHIMHIYGFGDLSTLPAPLAARLRQFAEPALELQNRLSGTAFTLDRPGIKIGLDWHPRGGGYVTNHVHPGTPQKVSVLINLSQPGRDYSSGGARFRLRGRWVDTTDLFALGDVLVWRYNLPHAMGPVDPDASIDWELQNGLCILAIELTAAWGKTRVWESG